MSKRGDLECVSDIKEAMIRIEAYIKHTYYQEFLKDTKTQDAVVRNLEIIGEAVKNISADFKKKHNAVEWRSIAGMRDKLIHHYFGVNLEIIWDIAANKILKLKTLIEKISKG